jgi:hypothetical protein
MIEATWASPFNSLGLFDQMGYENVDGYRTAPYCNSPRWPHDL